MGTRMGIPHIPPREREILALVVQGKTSKEIAAALWLSLHTVTSYRRSLHARLGCSNAASLVRRAIELHLVPQGKPRPPE